MRAIINHALLFPFPLGTSLTLLLPLEALRGRVSSTASPLPVDFRFVPAILKLRVVGIVERYNYATGPIKTIYWPCYDDVYYNGYGTG